MNEYVFEITQTLKRTIRINEESEIKATNQINSQFESGEIKLDQNDCIQSNIKLIKSNEDDEQLSLF